jgi:hypothetical protein
LSSRIYETHEIKELIGMKTYLFEIKRKTAATHVNSYRGAEYGQEGDDSMIYD